MRGITLKVVVEKNANDQINSKSIATVRNAPKGLKKSLLVVSISILLIALFASAFLLFQQQQIASMDPFTAETHRLVHFPLYYPTKLPAGYHIDKTSVSNPNSGVIVFTITDADSEHFIYASEEAKPKSFNFNGYYAEFSGRKNINTRYGTVVTGTTSMNQNDHTEIGSLASNKTWLIVNTNANIPISQLRGIFTSLVISH